MYHGIRYKICFITCELLDKEIKQEVKFLTDETKNTENMMKNIAAFVNDAINNGKNQNQQHKLAIGKNLIF